MFFESYCTSPLDRPVIVNKLEISDIRYIQGVPRNMTFNKQLFLVKQIFCLIMFYFEINFNIT